MLKFLKKLFANKEIEKFTVPLYELNEWFDKKAEPIFKELDEELESLRLKIKQEIRKCYENLDELDKAKLQNPNIPMRAKQAMEGNRENYIKKMKIFLDEIYLKHKDYDEVLSFCEDFNRKLENFAKGTAKSYQILQEFLANESSRVASNIRVLDETVKKLKEKITELNLQNIQNTKKSISELKNKIKKKQSLEIDFNSKEKLIDQEKQKKDKVQVEIEHLKKSDDFINLKKLIEKKETVEKRIYDHRSTLSQSFSNLEKAFKKFSRIAFEDEKLVEKYVESPIKTLLKDADLRIMNILKSMERSLNDDKLGLDEKKKKKSLSEIKTLNNKFFVNFLKKHGELKKHLAEIEKDIENSDIETKLSVLRENLEKVNEELDKSADELNSLEEELSRIDVQKLKENLQNNVNNLFDVLLTVS